MMIKHVSVIHGKCPVNGRWDYYEVCIETSEFLEVSEMESILDFVRGSNKTQEDVAEEISLALPCHCKVTLTGKHSQNTETVVVCEKRSKQ